MTVQTSRLAIRTDSGVRAVSRQTRRRRWIGLLFLSPALLLYGSQTRPWFRENVEILADLLPNARAQSLPGLDHMAPLTHPAELATAIAQFVSHPAPTPS